MATSTTGTSTSPEASSFSSPATIFSREGIHYFLDMVMDLFPITEQEQQQQQEDNKSNNHSSSTNASGTDGNEKLASEENSFEGEACGKNTNKEPSSNRSSYVDDSADDSSVEDTSHFIVGGMNMSRFGGVGGNGYRSTNAINFIPTAVTERTEEDNCSLATGYRLGRSSFSSVFQHHPTQNQINLVTSLSNLSHVFNTAIGSSTVGVVVPSPTSGQPTMTATTTTTTTGIGAAKVTSSIKNNTDKVITTTNHIEKNYSNLSDDGTVTTQEESSSSSSSNDSDDNNRKKDEDEINKTEAM